VSSKNLPMVARATDNGSWIDCQYAIPLDHGDGDGGKEGLSRLESRIRSARHLRKTARGASSPANPALHIPELQARSVTSFNSKFPCGVQRAIRGGALFQKVSQLQPHSNLAPEGE